MTQCSCTRIALRALAVLSLLLLIPAPRLMAQQGTGSIIGTVTDPSGAAVANAGVEIINLSTQQTIRLKTNQSGFYQSPPLVLGRYQVSVSMQGFQTTKLNDVSVLVDKRTEADAQLSVGHASQTVEVSAASASALNTNSGTLGAVIQKKSIQDLPLNGRNTLALTALTPGVRNDLNGNETGFVNRGTRLSAISINGSPVGMNSFILDGQNDITAVTGEVAINPNVDSIQEFKVQSGVMSAQYGFTTGGVVNMVTRSGGEHFHGSAYEFLRNDAFNARNAMVPVSAPTPELRYNQFGAALGGPIFPHRMFFFGNWEEYRYISGSPTFFTVPTAQERNGDFSDLFTASGKPIQLYDPYSTTLNSNHQLVRTPYLGNVIPQGELDPASLAIQKNFYPLPNTTPTNAFTHANNFSFTPKTTISQRMILGRIDDRLGPNDFLFGRYAYEDNHNNNGTGGKQLYPSPIPANRIDDWKINSLIVGWTHTFSSTLINDVRISATRQHFTYQAASFGGNWPQKLGLPASVPAFTLPRVNNGLPVFVGTAGTRDLINPELTDTVTKVVGTHTITFGTDLRYNIGPTDQHNLPSGDFNFAAKLTGNPQEAGGGVGSTYATFLLGAVSSASLEVVGAHTDRAWTASFFVQDDWRATPRLTMNLGLRYDYQQQPYEQDNGYSNFNPNLSFGGFKGITQYAETDGTGRNFVHENYLDFAPRIGFAYRLTSDGKTIVRGGFGIYYPPIFTSTFVGLVNGFSSTNTSYVPEGNNTNFPAFKFSSGFPHPPVPLQGAKLGPLGFLGQTAAFQRPYAPTPMSEQYTLSVERQLPYNVVLQASYVGNHGVHMVAETYDMNQLNPDHFSLGSQLQSNVQNPYAGEVPGSLGGPTITLQQSLLPFPYYGAVNVTYPHDGNFMAHYLELSAQRRSANGLTFLFGYTFGKLLDDSLQAPLSYLADNPQKVQNVYDRQAEYSLDPADVSQRATVSAVYELPFGQGHQLSSSNAFIRRAIGGWQANGIAVMQTGFPLSISGADNFTATRPNFVKGQSPSISHPTAKEWFNTQAFINPPDYTFGDVPRTLPRTRAPGMIDFDMSLFKTTQIHENLALQLRAEAFNLFNHVNYGSPNTSFKAGPDGLNSNGAFGTITSAADARSLQFAVKLIF